MAFGFGYGLGLARSRRAAPVMPAGAVGLWYADSYQLNPRPYLPNMVAVGSTPLNLLSGSRRAFSGFGFYQPFQVTVTDRAAVGPDGATDAASLVATGSSWYLSRNSILPAGTYTLAIHAKRGGGTDESFTFGGSSVRTATSAWQRYSHTFAHGGGNYQMLIQGTTSNTSLLVSNYECYAGSSDLGPEPAFAGHLFLDRDRYHGRSSYAAGVLNMTASASYGFVQFPADLDFSAGMTVVQLCRKTGASSGFVTGLAAAGNNGWANRISASLEHSSLPYFQYSGARTLQENHGAFWLFQGLGWHTFAHRYGGDQASIWLDSGKLFYQDVGLSQPAATRDFWFSSLDGEGYGRGWEWSAIAIWNRALSDEELRTAKTVMLQRAAGFGIAPSPVRVLIACGDSITAGPAQYASLFKSNASPPVIGAVYAVAGSSLALFTSQVAELIKLPANPVAGSKYIVSVMVTNGVNSSPTATYLATLQAGCDALRAAGWLVALGTIPPRNHATHNTNRAVINTAIRTWVGTHCDAIFDIAADATVGPDAAALNATYYPDGVHPSAAGQAIFEGIYRPVINAL